ncbi:PKD domain-containing protein [Aureivirga sp. CE67]|uniref:PKD domain-containing protein n=1 Tax=Aureivirga sp. CE67 TaxID=1788983 RepID=UPI0018CBE05E|nr:PKD domain-containing protein [Aureivirga sp. CE67]
MKKTTLQKLLLLCFLIFSTKQFSAQELQWAKRAGGDSQLDWKWERIRFIGTDAQGNVYVTGPISENGTDVDGVEHNNHGSLSAATADVMLASFDCEGNHRWSKLMGGYRTDKVSGLQVDAEGNSYITVRLVTGDQAVEGGIYIDGPEETIPFDSSDTVGKQSIFIIKHDTNGNLLWYKSPQPEDINRSQAYSGSGTRGLFLDEENQKLYWIANFKGVGGPLQINEDIQVDEDETKFFIMEYDTDGNYHTANSIDMTSSPDTSVTETKFIRNKETGNIYVGGYAGYANNPVFIGEEEIMENLYLAAFSPTGDVLWCKQSANEGDIKWSQIHDIAIDYEEDEQFIYLAGHWVDDLEFLGYTFEENEEVVKPEKMLFIKLDTDGNSIWSRTLYCESAFWNTYNAIGFSGNKVAIGGTYKVVKEADGTIIHDKEDNGGNLGILVFDKEDASYISSDFADNTAGGISRIETIAPDKKGNFYLGGNIENQIELNGETISTSGSGKDLILVKYGHENCDCDTPIATFESTKDEEQTYTFNYTGLEDYDTISWDFGDGNTSNQNNPTHTFQQDGEYTVCVTTSNDCGQDTKCRTINTTISTQEFVKNNFSFYPNPAKNQLFFKGIHTKTPYTIHNALGQKIQKGNIESNQAIDISNLPTGTYFIQINNSSKIFYKN